MFKQCIHAVDIYENNSIMTFNRVTPTVANTLKKIHLSSLILNEFNSTLYEYKNEGKTFLSRGYT